MRETEPGLTGPGLALSLPAPPRWGRDPPGGDAPPRWAGPPRWGRSAPAGSAAGRVLVGAATHDRGDGEEDGGGSGESEEQRPALRLTERSAH